jgi:hypothetical protein
MRLNVLVREKFLVMAILLLLMCCFATSVAAKNTSGTADKWQYELTIYGWLPSIDGSLKYGLPPEDGGDVGVDASDILDSLNFVFMAAGEARYNKLSFGMDVIYMDLSNSKSADILVGPDPGEPLSIDGGLSLTAWLVTGVAGYDLVQTDKARMGLIGGFRYLTLDADLDITIKGPLPETPPPAHLSGSNDFWDGIVGVKGAFMLGKNWYIPYYADIGAGDSQLTWQLYAGIGYQFHWGDIKLGYRYLEYDMDDDKFVQDLKFYGPLMGIGFRF